MDIESHETDGLLKKRAPKRQSLALKLAVLLCGLGLLVNFIAPMGTLERALGSSSNFKDEKVTAAAAGVSTSRPASTISAMDWRTPAVAAPAWSVEDNDTTRAPFGYCARGGGFRMMSMHMGIARALGSTVDVLIVQSNYPEGLEGVPVIVPARGAKWAFSEIYGRLAALQAAGAAPIIEAWLAGELPLTSFP